MDGLNTLNQNMAHWQRVREDRMSRKLQNPGGMIGGPQADPRWDAFWGALDAQNSVADTAGMNTRVNFGSLDLPRSPAISGLRTAAQPRR